MIPMYNEDAEILMETVSHIAEANYDLSRVAVTLNGENAKRELYEEAWNKVREKFN